jgi:hypothetical protein
VDTATASTKLPQASQGELNSAAAEIFATLTAHVHLHADRLHADPAQMLRLVLIRAQNGLPPERSR